MNHNPYQAPRTESFVRRTAAELVRSPTGLLTLGILFVLLLSGMPLHPLNGYATQIEQAVEAWLGPDLEPFYELLGPLIVVSVALPLTWLLAFVCVVVFRLFRRAVW